MRKRVLCAAAVLSLIVGTLAGCGTKAESPTAGNAESKGAAVQTAGYAKDAKIKVWGSQEDQDMLKDIVKSFQEETPEAAGWTIETSVISAADAKNEILKDPAVGADVFEFASDQIADMQSAGVLYRITKNKDKIMEDNIENSVEAGMIDGELYGYPSTSNTYFMYYDKKYYNEEEIKSFDTMLAKDLETGVTNFSMDLDNGWYTASFFFGAGCKLFGEDGRDPKQCDFNNEKGVLVGDFLLDLCNNPKIKNQDDALLLAAFKDRTLGASFSGTWNAAAIKESLGDDFGVAVVPSLTLADGTVMNPSTIVNFNLFGVNAQTKYPAESMLFAEYLTSEKVQKIRFEVRNSSPTNKNLVADTALLNTSPAVAVLSEQVKTSTIQPSISQISSFWPPMEAFGQDCIANAVTKDTMQQAMDTLVTNVLTKIGG